MRNPARPKPTLRSRLLLAVNLPLAALVGVLLAYDYSQEYAHRLEDKQIALEEEAITILPAVLHARHHGSQSVQQYIDTVCGRMQDLHSPRHHIAVEMGDETFQAVAHHRASPEILLAMREAARSEDHRASIGNTEFVVGSYASDGVTVYVSESLEILEESVVRDILRRLAGFVALAIVAALVVNVVLERIVSRPLEQLVKTVQEIGGGQLGVQSKLFRSAELNYLAGEVSAMSVSLATADRHRRTQMAKAREIQQNLLPQDIVARGVKVGHVFEPADDVGGDYFDLLPLSDGSWLFCVADVTGHGVPAALTAAMLKTLLLLAAETFTSPAEMMNFINQRFARVSLVGDFVTMVLARVAPQVGSLQFASAGHDPAWLLSYTGEVRELSSTGIVLGVDAEAVWDTVMIDMVAGDRLLITTDGVSETINPAGKIFGRERLASLLTENRQLPVEQVTAKINEALKAFRGDCPQEDDVTIVLLEVTAE